MTYRKKNKQRQSFLVYNKIVLFLSKPKFVYFQELYSCFGKKIRADTLTHHGFFSLSILKHESRSNPKQIYYAGTQFISLFQDLNHKKFI